MHGGDAMGRRLEAGAIPKHVQVKELIAADARERLRPGDAIASERELMGEFGVSRTTIRTAIGNLVAEGVLQRTAGKGTFLAAPRTVESHLHLASFTQDMRRRGLQPSTRTLLLQQDVPPPAVSDYFGVAGEHWHVVRLRLAGGSPMAHEDGWYNAGLVPDLSVHAPLDSLYETFATAYGLAVAQAEQVAGAQLADPSVARLLHLPDPAVVLTFERRSVAAGRPLEHVVSSYRADRYRLHMTLDATMPPAGGGPSTSPSLEGHR